MELGVYIHFPFCVSRCGYCDFYSTVQAIPQREYADAVLGELERRAPRYRGLRLGSVYIGGGTPSLWQPGELDRPIVRTVSSQEILMGKLLAYLDRSEAREVWDLAYLPDQFRK